MRPELLSSANDATLAQAASTYAALGLRVVPLHHVLADGSCSCGKPDCNGSTAKHPWLAAWQREASASRYQVRKWWTARPESNVGLALGGESRLVALDIDGPEGRATLARWEADRGPLPCTLTSKSGRSDGGEHRIFRVPASLALEAVRNSVKVAPGIDVRATGGQIVVAPSRHASGARYQWTDATEPAELPQWLWQLLANASEREPDRQAPRSADHAGERADWTVPEGEGWPTMGEREHRARAWLAHAEPAVSGQAGHATAMRVATGAVRGFALDREHAARALEDWNGRCEPPWSARELDHKMTEAARVGDCPWGSKLLDAVPGHHADAAQPSKPDGNGADLPPDVASFSDLANAHRLALAHGADLRHCPALGWLVWDGQRWQRDETGEASRRMHDVGRGMLRKSAELLSQAAREPDRDRAKALAAKAESLSAWARQTQSKQRIEAALGVAATLEGIAAAPDAFDCKPELLACTNGTLDLRSFELRPHERGDLITLAVPTAYKADAPCPTWLAFLDRIFDGNAELVAFVQRAVGYSLAAEPIEQVFFVLHGSGANGKSTMLEALAHVLGEGIALSTPSETFMARRGDRPTNDLARLRGARLVTSSETGEGRSLDEGRVKELCGGERIVARFLYRDLFAFRPRFVLWLATNHKPRIRGTDHAIWRRIRLVPYNVTIPPAERDKRLPEKLRAEAEGILAWCIEGLRAWRAQGLGQSPDVEQATAAYRSEQSPVARWIAEECRTGHEHQAEAGQLFEAFSEWAKVRRERALTQTGFGRALGELGYEGGRAGGGRKVWFGLALLGDEPGGAEQSEQSEQLFRNSRIEREHRESPAQTVRNPSDPSASGPLGPIGEPSGWGELRI